MVLKTRLNGVIVTVNNVISARIVGYYLQGLIKLLSDQMNSFGLENGYWKDSRLDNLQLNLAGVDEHFKESFILIWNQLQNFKLREIKNVT